MDVDQKEIKKALIKAIKEGIPLEIEYYDKNWIAKECAKEINKKLKPEGYSAHFRQPACVDIYYIQKKDKISTVNIGPNGIVFDKNMKVEYAVALSPAIRIMMETIINLTEN